ncbi:unnamed protein product [Aphanomyces euteiches]|uniref:Tubby C-terminal domain-containing protein n=1 Tax=Aphanomyces euteiches TaxID=100861 RepID=A0A6G0XFA1_9STRA|nr:hypothetical protein Ae201684_005497 [Aphanomyces euteiches]KAH9093123.1 hypothetical protein Ae201684P_008783 [Aphanomyces euteiches]KAH9139852.1 hypothetical protein AeRB84_015875 [Aphanomyces euteiches]
MASRAAPPSNARQSNQKSAAFKEKTAERSRPHAMKPAWEVTPSTYHDDENQVTPFSVEQVIDEDDHFEDEVDTKHSSPSDDSDSENEDDPKNVSVACSEWLSAAAKAASDDDDEDKAKASKEEPNECHQRFEDDAKELTKRIEMKKSGGNQSADHEFSPLRAQPGTALIEGSIVRCNNGTNRLAPQYQFFIKNKLVLLAQKQLNNRTSNYHIFDMSRGAFTGQRLTKKSGNYVGKLRSSFSKQENVMVSAQAARSELGAVLFDSKISNSKPRKLKVVCPRLSSDHETIPHAASKKQDTFSALIEQLKTEKHPTDRIFVFESKEPEYEKGCYRLNFNGRVSIPSVKNFQLVATGHSARGIVLQFGKVSDKLFHLDFKHPITPFQAFAIALSQFNY